jgi:hypothetical protein
VNGLTLKNVKGYGILLVEGDLILEQNTEWNGIIFVTGGITFTGGGTGPEVHGGVLANTALFLDNPYEIRYDTCEIAKAFAKQPLKIKRWRIVS